MLNNTIINLTKQEFFCIPVQKDHKDTNGEQKKKPFFSTNPKGDIPAQKDAMSRQISLEEWEKIFKNRDYQARVDKIAICGGHNGAAIFDFDIKGRPEGEDLELIKDLWKLFIDQVKRWTCGEYYLERSRSGGEHLIFLVKDNYHNLCSISDLAVTGKHSTTEKQKPFVETLGYPVRNKKEKDEAINAKFCIIAPSTGYTKLGGEDLWDLNRVESSIYEDCIKFWGPYRPNKPSDKYLPKSNRPLHTYSEENIFHAINNANRMEDILERHGYQRSSNNRFLYQHSTSGTPGVIVLDNKVYSNHGSDPLNNGRLNDCAEVLCMIEHNGNKSELTKEWAGKLNLKRRKPKSKVSANNKIDVQEILRDETAEGLIQKIFYKPEGGRVLVVKNLYGKDIFLTNEVLNSPRKFYIFADENYPSAYRVSGEYRHLKHLINQEIALFKDKEANGVSLKNAIWDDSGFRFKSSKDIYIENEVSSSKGSFEVWQKEVAFKAKGYHGRVLCLVLGLAGPFVSLLHHSFGINLVGESGMGKTMSMHLASSAYMSKDIASWGGTIAYMSRYLSIFTNFCVCVDELASADKDSLSHIIGICGGKKRGKCELDGDGFKISIKGNDTPMIILSSSELSFVECARRQKVSITKGFTNRFIDINVTKEHFGPVEEQVKINKILDNHYGVALEYFLERLNISGLNEEFEKFKEERKEALSIKTISRTVGHFLFLGFIAKKMKDTGVINYHAEESIYRFMGTKFENSSLEEENFEGADLLKRTYEMMNSSEYTSRNHVDTKPAHIGCFFTSMADIDDIDERATVTFLHAVPFRGVIKKEFGLGDHEIMKILRDNGVISKDTKKVKIRYDGTEKQLYLINEEALKSKIGIEE